MTVLERSARAEQSRARYPDEDRIRRARRRAHVLGGATATATPTLVLLPTWIDRPLALLEGADPVPGPPLPGRDLRRARQRALGSPGGRPGLHAGGVRRRHAGGDGRHRHRARDARRALVRRAVGDDPGRRAPATGSTASSTSRLRSGWRPATPSATSRPSKTCSRSTRAGPSTTITTGAATTAGSSSSSSPSASTSRTRPSRSRTRSAGRSTPTRRRWPTPLGASGSAARNRQFRDICARVELPDARDPRRRRPGPATGPGRRAGRGDRGAA